MMMIDDATGPPLYDSKEYWQSTAVTAFRMLLEEYGRRKEAQDRVKELEEALKRSEKRVSELWSREVPKPKATDVSGFVKPVLDEIDAQERWSAICRLGSTNLRLALDEALTERGQLQVDVNELEDLHAKAKRDLAAEMLYTARLQRENEEMRQELEVQRKQLVELRNAKIVKERHDRPGGHFYAGFDS